MWRAREEKYNNGTKEGEWGSCVLYEELMVAEGKREKWHANTGCKSSA